MNGKMKLAALTIAFSMAGLSSAHAEQLKAGASKVDITPEQSEFPYTAPGERTIVGIHDNVFVRSVVFSEGNKKIAMIVMETTIVPDLIAKDIVEAVSSMLNIPQENVLLTATHNHGVPLTFFHTDKPDAVMQQELTRVKTAAIQAAKNADQQLSSAKISYARGEGWVNVNNGESAGVNNLYDSDHHFWTSESNPHGIANRNLDVVKVTGLDNKPIAMIVNYASHAEVMFRSATKNGGYEVTGDLPGAVSNLLENHKEGAPVVLYTAAAEADQLPVLKSRQLEGAFPYKDEGAGGWSVLSLLSRQLATSVIETEKHLSPAKSDVSISAVAEFATCPGQKGTRDPKTTKVTYKDASAVNIGLGSLTIGDIAFAGISGDVATKIGNAIKDSSPLKNTIVVSMRSGYVGYVLSDDYYQHPDSHAVAGSSLKPGCAEKALPIAFKKMISK